MLGKLISKFPNADEAHLAALADVWAVEHDRVIRRMIDISGKECTALPSEVRHEALFEMAKLILFLEDKIIEKKLSKKSIDEFAPALERRWLDSPECEQRIENTAQIMAERIWNRFVSKWWKKHPVITGSSKPMKTRKFVKGGVDGVRRQHYSPHFSNKHWTDDKIKVRIYSRALDGGVKYEDKPVKSWGRSDFLYSQRLELLFGAIETDAGQPYKYLLDMIPFSEDDRRHWIAFLIAQLFRTPSFILGYLPKLRNIIQRDGFSYPMDVAGLRRVYETLFTNNQIFSDFYKLICGHEWTIWTAPTGHGFLRADTPVIVTGLLANRSWQLLYTQWLQVSALYRALLCARFRPWQFLEYASLMRLRFEG